MNWPRDVTFCLFSAVAIKLSTTQNNNNNKKMKELTKKNTLRFQLFFYAVFVVVDHCFGFVTCVVCLDRNIGEK